MTSSLGGSTFSWPFHDLHHAPGHDRLDVAQRHRKQWAALQFQDAEGGRELCQRRVFISLYREWELIGVAQRSLRVILHSRRQLDRESRALGKGLFERNPVDEPVRFIRLGPLRQPLPAAGSREDHFGRVAPGDRGGKTDVHRRDWNALRLGILSRALEQGHESGARDKRQDPVLLGGDPALRLHSASPDQIDAGLGGKFLARLQQQQILRRFAVAVFCLKDFLTLGAGYDAHADPAGDSVHRESHVLENGGLGRHAVERQREDLPFIDRFGTLVRPAHEDGRTARRQTEIALPGDFPAGQGACSLLQAELAAHSRGKIAIEVVGPVAVVRPAGSALFRARNVEWLREPQVAEGHHRIGKTDTDLAHLPDGALWGERLDARQLLSRAAGCGLPHQEYQNRRKQSRFHTDSLSMMKVLVPFHGCRGIFTVHN